MSDNFEQFAVVFIRAFTAEYFRKTASKVSIDIGQTPLPAASTVVYIYIREGIRFWSTLRAISSRFRLRGEPREKSNAIREVLQSVIRTFLPPGCTGSQHMARITKGCSPRLRQLSSRVTRSVPLRLVENSERLREPREWRDA